MNTQINFYGCYVHCTKLFQFCMHLYQTRSKDVVYLSELNISIEPIFGEHFCQIKTIECNKCGRCFNLNPLNHSETVFYDFLCTSK